jgi:hypothetical protein
LLRKMSLRIETLEHKTDWFESKGSSPLQVIGPDGHILPLLSVSEFDLTRAIVASLSRETETLFQKALRRHRSGDVRNMLTLLVPPRTPPQTKIRRDDVITDFLASGPWTSSILDQPECCPRERCFRALAMVLNDPNVSITLDVVHDAETEEDIPACCATSVDIVLAHRGADEYLEAAVASILKQNHRGATILCFDQEPSPTLCRELARNETLQLYEVVPSPAGPYVPRQHFCLTSPARYVAFQDTDDFSLPTRIGKLLAFAEAHDASIVGCHELRFNELTQTVEAIRLPLDANRGLDDGPGAVQLFATTVIRTDCLRRLGGFSTNRTFGADRQFQLRAHWSARMLNIDAFLYVRRLREGSLTTAVNTGMQSQIRQEINAVWQEAFHARQDGRIALEDSELRVEPSNTPFVIRDLRTEQVFPALLTPNMTDIIEA